MPQFPTNELIWSYSGLHEIDYYCDLELIGDFCYLLVCFVTAYFMAPDAAH
jgi:hypothetical protein